MITFAQTFYYFIFIFNPNLNSHSEKKTFLFLLLMTSLVYDVNKMKKKITEITDTDLQQNVIAADETKFYYTVYVFFSIHSYFLLFYYHLDKKSYYINDILAQIHIYLMFTSTCMIHT